MLEIVDITRAFENKPVLRGIDLHVQRGEILCLLGPSGCGKTTLLRIIAGLERADTGEVVYDGQSLRDVPVHQRDFGLMFQDFALFPHMNVAENVAFGLKMRRAADIHKRVQEVIEMVGLSGFERRDVTGLSGGEKQRVALARSLASRPRLLMLDEPLGSLDAALRARLVLELRQIIQSIGLTTVYVTHDQQEAFAIADRIAIMNTGLIEQVDSPQKLYWQPAKVFVAMFLGLNNVVPVLDFADGQALTALGPFRADGPSDALLLHPRGISLTDQGPLHGKIGERVFQGDVYQLTLVHASGIALRLYTPADSPSVPAVGQIVHITVQPGRVRALNNQNLAIKQTRPS